MTESHPNIKKLPVEILHHIFRKADRKDLCKFAVVCKTWLYPAQATLYSNVYINTLSRLSKFHNTVKYNAFLGVLIKSFRVSIYDHREAIDVLKITSSLLCNYLPNLEQFDQLNPKTYLPLLDALATSRLGRLKLINEPNFCHKSEEVANFATCILMMKNRLEKLMITNDFIFEDGTKCEDPLYFNRLYYNIHLFDNLTALSIKVKTNEEIQVLEHLVEHCRSLRELVCRFKPSDTTAPFNTTFSIDAIKRLTPRPNIKILTYNLCEFFDEKVFIYIAHKFPQLESYISRSFEYGIFPKTLLTPLLQYLFELKNVNVIDLKVDKDSIEKTLNDVWRTTCALGSEEVEFAYTDDLDDRETIAIIRSEQKRETTLCFTNSEWIHFDFLKKNGEFVKNIKIVQYGDEKSMSDNVIGHIAKYCPNLKQLQIKYSSFELSPTSTIESDKTLSLDELYLDLCYLGNIALKRFCEVFSEVKHLRLDADDCPTFEIIMPYTKINLITLIDFCGNTYLLYIKVLVLSTNEYYYYQLDLKNNIRRTKESDEREYSNPTTHKHLYVCCQTKPAFELMDFDDIS